MEKEIFSKIIYNKKIAKDTFEIKLDVKKDMDFIPGQFVNVKINRADLLLRRPISVHRYDQKSGQMTLIYKVVGKGTQQMSLMVAGEKLSLLCGLGNGITIDKNDQNIFLIGGGMGCAPLLSVIDHNDRKTFTTFLGFDTKSSIFCMDEFDAKSSALHITTDDGSFGTKGFITDILKRALKENKPDLIFACGPTPMLKSLKSILGEYDIKTYISIEERMGCGMGGCAVCACKTNTGVKKACVDGPVFDLNEVIL